MKTFNFCFILVLSQFVSSQENYLKTDFAVRDFFIKNDTISYIAKRHVFIKSAKATKSYFIGGYGLEIYNQSDENQIITVSNELRNTVCSVRFYNKSLGKVEDVYYYTQGRALDAFLVKEMNIIALSLDNQSIVILDFSKKPMFEVKSEIQLKSNSRRIFFENGELYYCTDKGEIYKYNMIENKHRMIYKTTSVITDLEIIGNNLLYSTIDGTVVKVNIDTKREEKLKLEDDFILNNIKFDDNIVCGSWKGIIYVISLQNFKIIEELHYHKGPILKIFNNKDSIFYSSSIDKTIKKWRIKNQFK